MSQHDMNIANQGFPAFRADLNDALGALVSNSSGATAPSTTFAHQFWVDTAADPSILKIRNADNDAWITIGSINQTDDKFKLTPADGVSTDTISELTSAAGVTIDGVLLKDSGVVTGAGTVSAPVYSTTGDLNTGIFFPAADTIAFAEGGAEAMRIDSSGNVGIGTSSPAVALDVVGQVRASTGILFGSDTAAANALDDYEEGTWTPVIGGSVSNGTLTYGTRQGRYTKVGNMVTCWARVDAATVITGGSGTLEIQGLPFTAITDANLGWFGHSTIGYFDGLSAYGTATNDMKLLGPQHNTTHVRFHNFTNAGTSGTTNPTQAQITGSSAFYVGFSYQV